MDAQSVQKFDITFPGDLEYIPAVRKFVSELLVAYNFSQKFAYRSEVIVDELCNNAVTFGCSRLNATVRLQCRLNDSKIELIVEDEGGNTEDIKKLEMSITGSATPASPATAYAATGTLGLDLVRMLSDEVNVEVMKNSVTAVHVVKHRLDDVPTDQARVGEHSGSPVGA